MYPRISVITLVETMKNDTRERLRFLDFFFFFS
jgi:hypothetical protein